MKRFRRMLRRFGVRVGIIPLEEAFDWPYEEHDENPYWKQYGEPDGDKFYARQPGYRPSPRAQGPDDCFAEREDSNAPFGMLEASERARLLQEIGTLPAQQRVEHAARLAEDIPDQSASQARHTLATLWMLSREYQALWPLHIALLRGIANYADRLEMSKRFVMLQRMEEVVPLAAPWEMVVIAGEWEVPLSRSRGTVAQDVRVELVRCVAGILSQLEHFAPDQLAGQLKAWELCEGRYARIPELRREMVRLLCRALRRPDTPLPELRGSLHACMNAGEGEPENRVLLLRSLCERSLAASAEESAECLLSLLEEGLSAHQREVYLTAHGLNALDLSMLRSETLHSEALERVGEAERVCFTRGLYGRILAELGENLPSLPEDADPAYALPECADPHTAYALCLAEWVYAVVRRYAMPGLPRHWFEDGPESKPCPEPPVAPPSLSASDAERVPLALLRVLRRLAEARYHEMGEYIPWVDAICALASACTRSSATLQVESAETLSALLVGNFDLAASVEDEQADWWVRERRLLRKPDERLMRELEALSYASPQLLPVQRAYAKGLLCGCEAGRESREAAQRQLNTLSHAFPGDEEICRAYAYVLRSMLLNREGEDSPLTEELDRVARMLPVDATIQICYAEALLELLRGVPVQEIAALMEQLETAAERLPHHRRIQRYYSEGLVIRARTQGPQERCAALETCRTLQERFRDEHIERDCMRLIKLVLPSRGLRERISLRRELREYHERNPEDGSDLAASELLARIGRGGRSRL